MYHNELIVVAMRQPARRRQRPSPTSAATLRVSLVSFAAVELGLDHAHPALTGYLDFFSLLAGTAILAWLWRVAASADGAPARRQGRLSHQTPQRSPT